MERFLTRQRRVGGVGGLMTTSKRSSDIYRGAPKSGYDWLGGMLSPEGVARSGIMVPISAGRAMRRPFPLAGLSEQVAGARLRSPSLGACG
jgi:hypothetical protein